MPKNKRAKVISATKVTSKGSEHKELLVQRIKTSIDQYKYLFVFQHENMTTIPYRKIQEHWKDSKFFLGKNKVMQIALGRDENEAFKTNLNKISEILKGDCGLLFSNEDPKTIKEYFENYQQEEFARSGEIASETIILKSGAEVFKRFTHSIEPYLRKLGLQTQLKEAEIHLVSDFVLSEQGKPLSVEQSKILRLINKKMAFFRINILAYWKHDTCSFFDYQNGMAE